MAPGPVPAPRAGLGSALRVDGVACDDPQAIALRHASYLDLATLYPAETAEVEAAGGFRALDARLLSTIVATSLAWLDEEPVGCASLRPLRVAGAPPSATVGELKKVFVAPHARGRGVGRAVLRHVQGQARSHGFTSLVLETGPLQVPAQRLYLAAGYESIDEPAGRGADPEALWFGTRL